jgi:hypothetical protein
MISPLSDERSHRATRVVGSADGRDFIWLLLILVSIATLYLYGLPIRYGSDDDVVISWWYHHDLYQQAEICAKSAGRFFLLFLPPISSALLQIPNEFLFDAIRLLPFLFIIAIWVSPVSYMKLRDVGYLSC